MQVVLSNLSATNERFNLAPITGSISESLSGFIDQEIEQFSDHFYETTGEDIDTYCKANDIDFHDEITVDFKAMMIEGIGDLIDILEHNYRDVFSGIVKIEIDNSTAPTTECYQPDNLPVLITVKDPVKLFAEFHRVNGSDQIWNGEGRSGFYRTADDLHWTIYQVLDTIVGDEALDLIGWITGSGVYEDMIEYGKLQARIDELY